MTIVKCFLKASIVSSKMMSICCSAENVAEAYNARVGGIKKSYTHCIFNQLDTLKKNFEGKLVALHVLRVGNKPKQQLGRFLFMPDSWSAEEKGWMDVSLAEYIVGGVSPPVQTSFVQHLSDLPDMPNITLEEQVSVLCSIPNYHWWDFVKMTGAARCAAKPKVSFSAHLLYSPDEVEVAGESSYIWKKHPPTSPRNRLMMFVNSGRDQIFIETIQKLIAVDTGEAPIFMEDVLEHPEMDETVAPPLKKARRNAGVRVLKVDRSALSDGLGVDLNSVLNCQDSSRRLFSSFKEQLIGDGLLQWRTHKDEKDVVLMSDYDPCTGEMMPCCYVHVSVTSAEHGDLLLSCTCSTYNLIQKAAAQHYHLVPGEEGVMDPGTTCMHCRFYSDLLLDFWEKINSPEPLPNLHLKIMETMDHMEEEVILLGNALPQTTSKFSIKGEEDHYSIVTISFRQGQCWARCTEGVCSAKTRNKKKIPKLDSLQNPGELCTHLQVLGQHLPLLRGYFPEFFSDDEEEREELVTQPVEEMEVPNLEDATLRNPPSSVFDVDTGLWCYKSYSEHVPHQMFDLDLIRLVLG